MLIMRIQKIELANFANHDRTVVEFPDAGVVLVTGANGSGKSSVAEAITHALWDASLRAEPGWRLDQAGGVEVSLGDTGFVRRNVTTKGSKKLAWQIGNDGSGAYPTTSKSQQALEERIGTFDAWCATSTFTADAPRFAAVSDATRKALLEELLGLGRFDEAYKKSRAEASDARAEVSQLEGALGVLKARADGLRAQVTQAAEASDGLGTLDDLDVLRREAEDQRKHVAAMTAAFDEADEADRAARRAHVEATTRMGAAQKQLDDFDAIKAECPACQQDVDPMHALSIRDQLLDILGLLKSRVAETSGATRLAGIERAKASASKECAHDRMREITARGQALKADIERREQWEARESELSDQLASVEAEVDEKTATLSVAKAKLVELKACCDVLGLQGARAGVLASSLRVLEGAANGWLSKLGTNATVKLSSQTTSKSGGVSDRISIELTGVGGGRGYRAASSGQKRRIDLAFQLALSELPSTRAGLSLLVFDEAFDALDAEGTEHAVQLLEELSQDRCVLVISHSRDLVDRLPEAVHLHVQDGVVSRLRG